jgi:hypothetical protein
MTGGQFASTQLSGKRDHLVLFYTNTFIMNEGPVADQIDAFLRRGRFDRGGVWGAEFLVSD